VTNITLREPIDIIKFIGLEHEQILVSLARDKGELAAVNHLQGLYCAAMTNVTVKENEYVITQLLFFSHYHFLYGLSCHMRCHLSEAFASARAAIDAALIAAQIIHDRASQVAYANRTKPFDKLNRHYKNMIKSGKPLPHLLVPTLIDLHDKYSMFASHADVASFVHRVKRVDGEMPMLSIQYFQFATNDAERQIHVMTLLHTFVMILDVFSGFLVGEMKIVSDDWRQELYALGGKIERRVDELKKQLPDHGTTGMQESTV
jgi:hypothetical protein